MVALPMYAMGVLEYTYECFQRWSQVLLRFLQLESEKNLMSKGLSSLNLPYLKKVEFLEALCMFEL